jgi:hypothetical protein
MELAKGIDIPFTVRLPGFHGGIAIGKRLAAIIGYDGQA